LKPVRILIADDHRLVRAGIRALLEGIPGVTIVGEADNGRDAIAMARAEKPALVVMDISMKELNGIEATARLKAEFAEMRVLILSMHTTEDFVRRALTAGASGYLVKDSAPLELEMAIGAVMRGENYISSRVSRHLVARLAEGAVPGQSSIDSLTPRQREILQLVAEGKVNKQIAADLCISIKTVEKHRQQVMNKLNIHDVAGLTRYAIARGIIESTPQLV